jgi:6-phosphogluconolactonase
MSRTQFSDDSPRLGGVFAFQRSSVVTDTGLSFLNKITSNREGGVHCTVSPDGKTLAAADITASTVTAYPLLPDGKIGQPTNIFDYNMSDIELKEKNIVAHPYSCGFDPTGEFMFVPALTGDCIYVYSVRGPDEIVEIQKINLPLGLGPRYAVFRQVDRTRSYMYLLSERDNSYLRIGVWEGSRK